MVTANTVDSIVVSDNMRETQLPPLPPPPPPPPGLFERLSQIAGYTWDDSKPPFHSSYDIWHVFGTRHVSPASTAPSLRSLGSSSTLSGKSYPARLFQSEVGHYVLSDNQNAEPGVTSRAPTLPADSISVNRVSSVEERVVARLSLQPVREERAFHIAQSVMTSADPEGDHIVKPIDLLRLSSSAGERGIMVVAIYTFPGRNLLFDILDMGPAFYEARRHEDSYISYTKAPSKGPIGVNDFLDFAIGVAECLELLHHGQGMVHGEIRGDAFHFNAEERKVRIISFGSGQRSFEQGLTSTGWSSLSIELGAKNKLLYISPEQTGRMPAEPDSRTDIYSVGVLFWMLLTQQPVYSGDTPLDIVQGVLGRKIPNVATIRIDAPDVVGRIIQKCTAKNAADRYHSASGLRHDLVMVQKLLEDGGSSELKNMAIGSRDVSSFFLLPSTILGRHEEIKVLLQSIDRVAKSHSTHLKLVSGRALDANSLSTEISTRDDVSSEEASSTDGSHLRHPSVAPTTSSDQKQVRSSFQNAVYSDNYAISNDAASSSHSAFQTRSARPWERQPSTPKDSASVTDSLGYDGARNGIHESSASSLPRHLGAAKFRQRGKCEIIAIEGAGGLGKTSLVLSLVPEARRRGYCATAKFDPARRTAFGPLLKLLSSLFKQVWGERNTETPFHQGLKHFVRPVWSMLHKVLGLPEFLLGLGDNGLVKPISIFSKSGPRGIQRRDSSGGSSPASTGQNHSITSQSAQEYLCAGASTKTTRLMNICLDILRVFTTHKFICFCLDDIHFADDESLELITQIIGARMRMVIVMTYRPDELPRERLLRIIPQTEPERASIIDKQRGITVSSVSEPSWSSRPIVTTIALTSLSENDILNYVSALLSRPRDEVLSLALVIQSKTAGNPFYMREMLSACHRKKCIWFDYRDSRWHYDLDRLFAQFHGKEDYDVLDTTFITHRLSELPCTARAVLAWGALIGSSFSFELVSRLMEGEFSYSDDDDQGDSGNDDDGRIGCHPEAPQYRFSEGEAVYGLQAAIQAYIIVPGETDDIFRFAHDRYIHASAALRECNARRMHFIISQTLLKYHALAISYKDRTAYHICEAVSIIRRRVPFRHAFRQLLVDCAQLAVENGARPTAIKYYMAAIQLLQHEPWLDENEDVSYEETTQLHLRAAECHLFIGHLVEANDLLLNVFAHAKLPIDKAPAYVLQSRIYAQNGNAMAAFLSLSECLSVLGVPLDPRPTYQQCDERFLELAARIQSSDITEITRPRGHTDGNMASIGAVLSETASAAWWSDCLQHYQVTLIMLEMCLFKGIYPQSGMAFLQFGAIALARFRMTHFAVELGSICQDLLHQGQDAFTLARGQMLHATLIGHIQYPISRATAQMEDVIEMASVSGDRISTILSYGLCAQNKFFASENCVDLEGFCQYGCEEILDWSSDTRGGAMLISIRQLCRALQGKTQYHSATGVMSDEHHDSITYKSWLTSQTQESNRSNLFYESFELVVLFLYGHYDRAVVLGKSCVQRLPMISTARPSRLVLLFYGLARAGQLLRLQQDPRVQSDVLHEEAQFAISELREFVKMMADWSSFSDSNYRSWLRLLEAQIAELSTNHGQAVQHYEEALDHAAEQDFFLEEALGNYLMAGFFIRRRARRSARAALQDALGLYRQVAAIGVARAIEEEHSLLLHGPTRNHRTAEAGVQTELVADVSSAQFRAVDGDDGVDCIDLTPAPSDTLSKAKDDRIGVWRGSTNLQADGAGLPALDMIDLHAILVSSQVISSVLQVDELLKTMCDVILQTCGGSASRAAILVQENGTDPWSVAASGDPEHGASAHIPGLPLSGTSLIAENVVLYCTRFLEPVIITDVMTDERFGNVSEAWLQRNPSGKAIIAIPISHGGKLLLGVLYLEGEPDSFTDRNVTVLQLLVNQIGISYSNALSMKNLEKISAENRSMVSVQKRALAKALEAETKAKHAEAEAKRNVKLAEEAAKAKSIFLANVSHELRTPLNGVIGNSELLRDSGLSREQLEMADSIRLSADLLLTVINDILDFSKMEADKMKLYIIAFNPEEMVREVVRAVSYSNREKTSHQNVQIVQDIDLPAMLIFGDPIRLHQVLGNLIGNSLKFTENGSITIGARLDSDTEEQAVLTFWVRDTGIGIPPQQLAKLFQPFSQADTSTARKYGGSGLGLSICKSLIEIMMQGRIQLESKENAGTTAWFTVSFDKAKPNVSAGDAQSKSSPPIDRFSASISASDTAASLNPFLDLSQIPKEDLRVCVAEDNLINQKIAIQYVQRLGFVSVGAYENGLKAVEGLRQKAREGKPYHIVLMDVQMPVLDGYEATKLLRKDSMEVVRKVLVIAMTASAIQGDREKCLASGMNDYLAKPVRSEVLKRKLDAYINREVRGKPAMLRKPDSIN